MRAEFLKSDDDADVVGAATWDGRHALVDADDPEIRSSIEGVFRPTPVVVDDAIFRPPGTTGEAVIQPGSLEWFRAAASARAPAEGLTVRFVPEVEGQGGWDPAAAYRPFRSTIARLVTSSVAGRDRRQAGEEGPEERAETGDQPRDSDAPPTVK